MKKYLLISSLLIVSFPGHSKRKEYSDVTNSAKYSSSACQLSAHCDKNKNPYWAKFQYAADLAEKEITKIFEEKNLEYSKEYLSNTSVVDSGFDGRSQIKSLLITPKLFKGYPEAGNEKIDPEGHGTAVSGMISGKGVGFTKYVNLNIYRVTKKYGGGSVRSEALSTAIKNACSNSDIVNVSWGSSADEKGMGNPKEDSWYDYAAKKGCLIVKSSGNGGIKRYNSYNLPITAPVILISSTNSLGIESSFSSQGHIYGPGENVFTLHSHQSRVDQWRFDKYCKVENSLMAPISGTSFSSPAVAAVFSQVLTVLKVKNLVPKNPAEKIALLKRIILASGRWSKITGETLPTANAYLAVLIAKHLQAGELNYDIENLITVGQREASSVCLKSDNLCSEVNDCHQKKECLNLNRKKMYLCDEQRKEITIDLINSFNQMKESEMLSYMGSRLNAKEFGDETIAEILNKSWEQNLDEKGRIEDSDLAFDLFERAYLLEQESFVTAKRFVNFLADSYGISGIDSSGDSEFDLLFSREKTQREKDQEQKAGVVSFEEIREKKILKMFLGFSLEAQLTIIKSIPKKQYSFSADYSKVQSGFLSLLVIHQDKLNMAVREELLKNVRKLARKMSKELKDNKGYVTSLNKDKIAIFTKFEPRFLDLIRKSIKRPYLLNSPKQIQFLANYSEILLGKGKRELSSEILKEVAGRIEFLESINDQSSDKDIEHAQKMFKSINSALPKILKNIIEDKTSDLSQVSLVKKILLSKLPLAIRAKIFTFSKYISTPYQRLFYDDIEFLNKYVLARVEAASSVYSLKGYIWEDSWIYSSRSLKKVISNIYTRVKYSGNYDVSFMLPSLFELLNILSRTYENERAADKITRFQLGVISKYILNRGEKYQNLVKLNKHASTLAIYAGTEIEEILKLFRKLKLDTNNQLFTQSMDRLKKEYDSNNDRLDIGGIREEIERYFNIGEHY